MNSAITPRYKYVIGVDPGETTGIIRLTYTRLPGHGDGLYWALVSDPPIVVQCNPAGVIPIITLLTVPGATVVAQERYVVNLRASRSKKAIAGQVTRDLNGQIQGLGAGGDCTVIEHTAAEAVSWCTLEKLEAAGLLLVTHEMRHARSAGRIALYTATTDLGVPDPLSRRAGMPLSR